MNDPLSLFPSDEHPDLLTLFDPGGTQARQPAPDAPRCPACGSDRCGCPTGTQALELGL